MSTSVGSSSRAPPAPDDAREHPMPAGVEHRVEQAQVRPAVVDGQHRHGLGAIGRARPARNASTWAGRARTLIGFSR